MARSENSILSSARPASMLPLRHTSTHHIYPPSVTGGSPYLYLSSQVTGRNGISMKKDWADVSLFPLCIYQHASQGQSDFPALTPCSVSKHLLERSLAQLPEFLFYWGTYRKLGTGKCSRHRKSALQYFIPRDFVPRKTLKWLFSKPISSISPVATLVQIHSLISPV